MLILEKPFCEEIFYKVKTIKDIKNSPNNSTLIFEAFDLDLLKFCKENDIEYGVITNSIKELIFASNLKAKYIFTHSLKISIKFQQVVEDYLLDTKIVYLADSLDEIEKLVEFKIDAIKLKESV